MRKRFNVIQTMKRMWKSASEILVVLQELDGTQEPSGT